MWDPVGNPEDRFSHNEAHCMYLCLQLAKIEKENEALQMKNSQLQMKNKGLKSELEEAEQQLDESEVMIG